jgi:hypothetical protein
MKGLILIVFLVAVILLGVQLFRTGPDNKSNLERTVDSLDKAKSTLNITTLVSVKRALINFNTQNGSYPDDLTDLIPDYINNESLLKDSWGNFLKIVKKSSGRIYLVSLGPDGEIDTEDDQKFPI